MHSVLVVISAVLLSSIVFALAGMINAVFAKNFDQISFIPTFVLTPLTYLGGVFYTIKLLPEWAQGMSHANPILYMVNAFRYGFLGVSDVDIRFAYTMMIGAAVALFTLRVAAAAGRRDAGVAVRLSLTHGSGFSLTLLLHLLAGSRISFSHSSMISRAIATSSSATATPTRLPSGSSPAPLCRNSPCTCACTPACSSTCMTMCAWMWLAAW